MVGCCEWFVLPFCCHSRGLTLLLTDDGKEEQALGAYWVTDGIDRCLVGFLPRHCLRHKEDFHGKLGQVVEMLKTSESPTQRHRSHQNYGVCRLALIDSVRVERVENPNK